MIVHLTFLEHLLCARPRSRYILYIGSFSPHPIVIL